MGADVRVAPALRIDGVDRIGFRWRMAQDLDQAAGAQIVRGDEQGQYRRAQARDGGIAHGPAVVGEDALLRSQDAHGLIGLCAREAPELRRGLQGIADAGVAGDVIERLRHAVMARAIRTAADDAPALRQPGRNQQGIGGAGV